MTVLSPVAAAPVSVPHRRRLAHLWAGAAAVLVAALVLATLDRVNASRIKRHAAALAALNLPETSRGVALQREIVRLPRCLPVYGSSELTNFQSTRADFFFRDHPAAGFRAALIGQPGDRCLLMLEELAALGDRLRGRKIVIFLSPTWFIAPDRRGRGHLQRQFARNFSPVQTARLLLDAHLDPALKAAIARRLMEHADAIAKSSAPLAQALDAWQDGSALQATRTRLVMPLLAAQLAVFRWQDRWQTLRQAVSRPPPGARAGNPIKGPMDWTGVMTTFDRDRPGAASAEFHAGAAGLAACPQGDREFLRRLNASPEWADLDLLLRTVQGAGARALLVTQPFNGSVYDACHVDAATRRGYYDRVRALAAAHGVPYSDFSDFEGDRSFFSDLVHPSARAWIYYDQVLDRFYHGQS